MLKSAFIMGDAGEVSNIISGGKNRKEKKSDRDPESFFVGFSTPCFCLFESPWQTQEWTSKVKTFSKCFTACKFPNRGLAG